MAIYNSKRAYALIFCVFFALTMEYVNGGVLRKSVVTQTSEPSEQPTMSSVSEIKKLYISSTHESLADYMLPGPNTSHNPKHKGSITSKARRIP
ncbi:hypothetical protein KP509_30G014700 [Ceratopteris richardii]|uniref:Uncharacterized protein n=1 Tax=Ceratopteris richardii TaxID=49495 RepID=A0A8T2R2A3_CERRI|nr:hypothetical protein KP509_30G014700 [Ceratopteris richardii]